MVCFCMVSRFLVFCSVCTKNPSFYVLVILPIKNINIYIIFLNVFVLYKNDYCHFLLVFASENHYHNATNWAIIFADCTHKCELQ